MRELVQADQRTTPQRSALDFFLFGCPWRVLGSASVASRLVSRQAHVTVPKFKKRIQKHIILLLSRAKRID